MSDLIDRQAAIDAVQHAFDKETLINSFVRKVAIDVLKVMPSAEPERKTGTWIIVDNQRREDTVNGNYAYICSNCLYTDVHAKSVHVPYCWNCGAKMKEKQNRMELIDRQEVLSETDKWLNDLLEDEDDIAKGIRVGIRMVRVYMKQMSAVQPEHKTGQWEHDGHHIECSAC